ncbi:hypothetical protein [Chryseobacterium sp. 3008163]|uniref:hypothetical protein n=1 Tax=Chryseobacterium sp. 3008163 TaxID=2478663 RepID=UPI001E56C8A4|nr:hypothetical protein [Chryseobacterium sp. 3008163]
MSNKGIIIKGLVDGVDTSTINGRLFLNLMASLAERTNAGLQSARARARGRTGGRPKDYTTETISKLLLLRSIYKDPTLRPEDIYKPLGLTRATFYRYAKILDHHTDEEIRNMVVKKK